MIFERRIRMDVEGKVRAAIFRHLNGGGDNKAQQSAQFLEARD